jgi:hypothetical protein
MLFVLTRSNLLRQLPDLNQIIRRLNENCYQMQFNGNILMGIAITMHMVERLNTDIKNRKEN